MNLKVKDITFVALFAAIMGVLGLLPPIMLAFTPVPITLQTIGILLAGGILGARLGFFSIVVFLLMVAAGMPLLSGGRGGLGVFVGPSAGYLFSYPLAALLIGYILSKIPSPRFIHILIVNILMGSIFLYIFGVPVQAFIMNLPILETIKISLVYIPGDILKAIIASIFVYRLRKYPIIYRRLSKSSKSL